ncbi:hypothetical protein G6F40_016043 [Rhizopus arrhizus]|nr:hypothetical protein G6F40_016043 [Rhizopus arrhizus]
MLARRCAGRHQCHAPRAVIPPDVALDGRVAAAVQCLVGGDVDDVHGAPDGQIIEIKEWSLSLQSDVQYCNASNWLRDIQAIS